MKSIAPVFAILLSLFSINVMAKAQSKFDKWPGLKAFHGRTSETFHASKEGHLKPIKILVSELVSNTDILSKSKIPAEFNSKDVVATVAKLNKNRKKLSKSIAAKSYDEAIKDHLVIGRILFILF